jgi:regulator of protease activity HflC (stomatin/prohibitin superfamily)
MEMASYIMAVIVVLLFGLLFAGGLFRSVTVYEYERALKYRKGRFVEVLGPGRYRLPAYTEVRKADIRPAYITVAGQEILTADSISVKVSVTARYEITDPVKALNDIQNYLEGLYLELQVALREIVGSVTIEEVLGGRAGFGKRLLQIAAGPADEFGVRVISVEIKDIMFPGALKQTFAQVAEARQEGLAALEKARGESAALRTMANAARLMDKSPGLGQLRMLQVLAESKGNTLILNLAQEGVPMNVLPKGSKSNS